MMMLKMLIAAWLVTHSLGRPDVSHLFKDNLTGQRLRQQNKSSFLEYLDSLNGSDVNELNMRGGSGFASRFGQFREFIQPSPFKRNTEEQGYTYEKPTVSLPLGPARPFEPFNPDANLIKPVSTQAPEYLPPSELESFTGASDLNSVPTSSQVPAEQQSYPGSTSKPIFQNDQDLFGEVTSHGPTQQPIASSTGYNGYTQDPVTQTGALGSRFENGYTGYTQEPIVSTRGPAQDAGSPTTISSDQEPVEGDNDIPVQPQVPNVDEKIIEPLDINELATTTVIPVTTRKFNGHIIPPKPLSELNVPIQESTPQTPQETYTPVTASVQVTSRSELGHVASTSAPEYLPPDNSQQTEGQDEVPEKSIPQDQDISNRFDQDSTTAAFNQETVATSGYSGVSQDSSTQGTTASNEIGYTSFNQETSAPENAPVSTDRSDSTSIPAYQSSTYEPFNDAPEGFTPSFRPNNEPLYSTATQGPYDVPSSTSAPDYLPPGSDKPEGFSLPSTVLSDGGFTSPTVQSTTLSEYRPEQTERSSFSPDNRFNAPTETSSVPADYESAPGTIPESGFSIVVEETTSSVPLELSPSGGITSVPRFASTVDDTITTYHPSSTPKPVVESEAEESELNPRVAIATQTTTYATQQPTEGTQRPQPVGPSHTLESDGYHYKIPSIPFP